MSPHSFAVRLFLVSCLGNPLTIHIPCFVFILIFLHVITYLSCILINCRLLWILHQTDSSQILHFVRINWVETLTCRFCGPMSRCTGSIRLGRTQKCACSTEIIKQGSPWSRARELLNVTGSKEAEDWLIFLHFLMLLSQYFASDGCSEIFLTVNWPQMASGSHILMKPSNTNMQLKPLTSNLKVKVWVRFSYLFGSMD